jgi:acyl-CoA thioesterase
MASLSHTVVFHVDAEGLSLVDETGKAKWFCLEEAIDHISHGRALAMAKIWDMKTGKATASQMQDGLIKMTIGTSQDIGGGLFRQSRGKKRAKI